jgi:hypothetical protein
MDLHKTRASLTSREMTLIATDKSARTSQRRQIHLRIKLFSLLPECLLPAITTIVTDYRIFGFVVFRKRVSLRNPFSEQDSGF